jgi:hypothetical protein
METSASSSQTQSAESHTISGQPEFQRITISAGSFSVGAVLKLQKLSHPPWDMSLSVPLCPEELVFVAASKSFLFSAPTGVSEKFC